MSRRRRRDEFEDDDSDWEDRPRRRSRRRDDDSDEWEYERQPSSFRQGVGWGCGLYIGLMLAVGAVATIAVVGCFGGFAVMFGGR